METENPRRIYKTLAEEEIRNLLPWAEENNIDYMFWDMVNYPCDIGMSEEEWELWKNQKMNPPNKPKTNCTCGSNHFVYGIQDGIGNLVLYVKCKSCDKQVSRPLKAEDIKTAAINLWKDHHPLLKKEPSK